MAKLKVRRFKVPTKTVLIVLILSVLLLFFTKKIFLQLALFGACAAFMIKYGSGMMLDVDPVPFASVLILYLSGLVPGILFLTFALPLIDILSGRFSHYSIINYFSAIFSLLLLSFIFPASFILPAGIVLFNIIRTFVCVFLGLGPETIPFNFAHAIIYFVLGSLLSYFI
jgi:hypothetical protein